MTNSEYFEKNKIPFAEAMEIFNKQKSDGIESFDKFLASEHVETKFKVGDLIVLQLNEETRRAGWTHQVVFKVVDKCDNDYGDPEYRLEFLTPHALGGWSVGGKSWFSAEFIDNCVLY